MTDELEEQFSIFSHFLSCEEIRVEQDVQVTTRINSTHSLLLEELQCLLAEKQFIALGTTFISIIVLFNRILQLVHQL